MPTCTQKEMIKEPNASRLNDPITAHLDAFRGSEIEEEITCLFPNPVFNIDRHILWIIKIAMTEGEAIGSSECYDKIGIELFDTFDGPVSLVRVLLRWRSDIAATVEANGDIAAYQGAAGRMARYDGSRVPSRCP